MTRALYSALRAEVLALKHRVATLTGGSSGPSTPTAHATSHQNGGTDEVNVAGLSGELADPQPPKAHKTSHQSGGSDAIQLDNLAAPDDNTDLNASTSAHGLMPKWTSTLVTALLDLISSTRGAILYRGAAAWAALAPGTATHVLTSNGAGADPSYQVTGSGTVTTTGSPANGNLAKFTGATSISNADLTGDVTTSGTVVATIANDAVTYAKMQNVSAADKLLGRGQGGGSGDVQEITLGTNLSMSGTTLNASGSGSGAEVLISEQTPSGTGTVTFATISGAYRDLRVIVRGRGTAVAASVNVALQFNADTGANYDRQRVGTTNGSTASAAGATGQSSMILGNIPAASATAGNAGNVDIRIYDYIGTTFFKNAAAVETFRAIDVNVFSGTWFAAAAAITQIDVILSSGNYAAGSVVSLYGIS